MLQLHDLSKLNSMIEFRFYDEEYGLEDLIKIVEEKIKGKNRYHFIIIDTKQDRIVKDYERGF